jgi:hypothetical protein
MDLSATHASELASGRVSELASEQFNTAACSRADERSEEGS